MPTYHGILHEADDPTPKSATVRAYAHRKSRVLTCNLEPGAAIYENDIARQLDLSKTPVREALGMLVHEGYVDVRPRQGYRVSDITLADVQEILHLRELLRPAAAELAAERATTEQLEQLHDLASPAPDLDYTEQVRMATDFHMSLAHASGSERLAATLTHLLEEVHRLFFIGLDLHAGVDHRGAERSELLDALLVGDGDRAAVVAAKQVATSRAQVLDAIVNTLTVGGIGSAADQVKLRP